MHQDIVNKFFRTWGGGTLAKSWDLIVCHHPLEALCRSAVSSVHYLQYWTGCMPCVSLFQDINHHTGPQETKNLWTKWLQTCSQDEVFWRSGAFLPPRNYRAPSCVPTAHLQNQQVCGQCCLELLKSVFFLHTSFFCTKKLHIHSLVWQDPEVC